MAIECSDQRDAKRRGRSRERSEVEYEDEALKIIPRRDFGFHFVQSIQLLQVDKKGMKSRTGVGSLVVFAA